jgi:endonuclease/exonuclease/phosphatase family metal-dependent hydrolase
MFTPVFEIELSIDLCRDGAQWNVVTPLLPIDHLLTSSDFVTTKRRICLPIGSDHFAVYAEVRLRSMAKKSDTSAAAKEQQ